jgi:hypothetical protein
MKRLGDIHCNLRKTENYAIFFWGIIRSANRVSEEEREVFAEQMGKRIVS